MGLLQELPNKEQLTSILAPVIGDGAEGTGVAGVLNLLENLDTSTISASLAAELDQTISANISTDTSALAGGASEQLQQVMTSFPEDPSSLIEPLTSRFENIKNLSSSELSNQLLAGIDGLQNIESLIPVDTSELVAEAAERLTQLKGEFISGTFGELRQWSESVRTLYTEIEPLLASGAGTVEERLIVYLSEKIADLVRVLLPQQQSLVESISTQLDAAISADRLSEINTVKTELINRMNQARIEFENGNFSNTAHLAAAQANFQQLTSTLEDIAANLRSVFDQEITTADGLARALQRQFDDFAQTEIIDLGNIRDKFIEAIEHIEEAIQGLNLDIVRETIKGVFEQINDVISQFDLSRLTSRLNELQAQIQSVLEALDGALFEAIAVIRNIFTQIRDALRSVASTLGSYDENGDFHFHIQQEIETFLNGVKTTLQEKVKPLLDQFKNTIGQTLQQGQDGLNAVQDQIESVKTQLQDTLQGINDRLQELDVKAVMENIRQELDGMLNELGAIDFDPIVDPVVAQIHEMRDALKQIDISSLNEFTIGALKVAVNVVIEIDFSAQITDTLMGEIDELLEIPKGALNDVEARVENVLQRFSELAPDALLSPLDDLFEPITTSLDALSLETLLEPLDAWYDRMEQELDKISPTALLQPLFDLYTQLQNAFNTISPDELIRPLQEAIDGVKAEIQAIDITGVAAELSEVIDRAKRQLDAISPEHLLNPLVNVFDKIMGALERFNPGTLLEPFGDILDPLTAPLNNLTAEHVRLIGEAFAPLHRSRDAFDPQQSYQTLQQAFSEVEDLLQQLNVGGLIAELRGPYNAMHAAFEARGGMANASLSVSVESLNPLRNEMIGPVVSDFQRLQTKLSAFAGAEPPAELVSRYAEIRPKLESLIPTWANENISPDSIRRAFQVANPLNITTEVNQLYDTMKEQLRNFDPRIVQEGVRETFDTTQETILGFDPEAIVGEVQDMIDALTQRLDAIDLELIVAELEGIVDEVETIVNSLNPQPIIDQLEELANEVKAVVSALQPSNILSDLNEPVQTAKSIVTAFDPEVFKKSLQEIFKGIETILLAIDIGIILQPLADRLDQLRYELEEGLKRTETAFNGMIAAIPV